jgi:3-oxoadipate enol-lactonase
MFPMTQDLQTADLPAGRLRYLDRGPRETRRVLLLVHGFPLGVGMWAPQIDAWPGWRLVVPALPGFDGSDPAVSPSIDAYAAQVVSLLDHLRIRRGVVAGLSMGGYVVFGVLRQAAGRIGGMILADTRSGPDTEEAKTGRRRLLESLEREGAAGVAQDLLPKLLGRTSQAERPEVARQLTTLIARQPVESIASATHALMERPDSTALLPAVAVPALVIVGEEDTLTPPAESERMQAAIPGAGLVRIPGAGHMSNMENPEAFNEAVRAFLASASGAGL